MRYKCIVSYDGYSYNGYQIQKHDSNTIQEEIQNQLKRIFKEDIVIYGSGRTDKMVHALRQVFHFDSEKEVPVLNLKKALNSLLSDSIKIIEIEVVDENFHSRYSAHKKVYEYKIKNTSEKNVFEDRYYAYIDEPIDITKLRECAKLFKGTHDFKNFTTNKVNEVPSFVKTIYSIKIKQTKECISIEFYGSGFLRYQIRMMVGAMLVVATNKKDISYISRLMKPTCNERCSYKADPQGLYLKNVIY